MKLIPVRPCPTSRIGGQTFEAYLLFLCCLAGVVGLLTPAARARSLVATFHPAVQLVWYGGLALGGLVGLFGLVRCELITGLLIERAGMLLLASMCLSFGFAALATSGIAGFTGVVSLWGFVVPCIFRFRQIGKELRAIREHLANE